MKTADGRKTISDREYKIFSGEKLISIEENMSDERFYEILSTEFGIFF